MSKKNKSKFKKQIKAQLMQEMAQTQVENKPLQNVSIPSNTVRVSNPISNQSAATTAIINNNGIDLAQIKYDLKKTGLIVLAIGLILGALYYFDLKYDILSTFGNWLFRVLNIQ